MPFGNAEKIESGVKCAEARIVSVIMNCFNSERYLKSAIDSVYVQTYKNWEIIFWDNASTDHSAEIAKSYGSKLRYFRGEQTVPLGAARNLAIKKTTGKYIAFLDCDDLWMPEKLKKQIDVFESKSEVDFVYSNFYKFNDKDRRKLVSTREKNNGNIFESLLYCYDIGILTVMLRAASFKKMDKHFDESLNLAEEYDVFMRLLYSAKAAYIPEPLAMHRVHAKMSTRLYWKEFSEEIDHIIDNFKNLDHDFDKKYAKALNHAKMQLEFQKAKDYMVQGELKQARGYLAPFKWHNLQFAILYLATHLPVSFWFLLRPIWTKNTFR